MRLSAGIGRVFRRRRNNFTMNRFNIFIMRTVLSVCFAVFLTRFFYGRVEPLYVAGLAIFLMGMSYVTEYYRSKKRNK